MTGGAEQGGAGAAQAAPKRRRWAGWALAASVCLNLALIGAVGGAVLRHGPPGGFDGGAPVGGPPGGAVDPWTLRRVIRMLPEAKQDEVRGQLRAHRPEFEALRPRRHEARAAAAAALEATPFQPEALAAALAAARDAERDGRDVIDRAFVDFATALDDDTRALLAQEMRKRRRPPPPGHGHGRDDDERGGPGKRHGWDRDDD